MSLLAGKCANPQNPKPGVTTSFCVYPEGHEGNCSWADVPDVRHSRLRSFQDDAAHSKETPATPA